jgi:radical SAM protein with 4Fe4S-binding SPASM domain
MKDFGDKILTEELGEKYADYRIKWERASKKELLTNYPLYLQIEHTGKCNLRCRSCIHGNPELKANYSRGFQPLNLELYKKILAEAKEYNCPSISFHNNDEPLLLEDLEERIRLAKEAGFIDLILVTNANLLTKERANNLLKSGLTKLNFSVDGWNEETYGRVRIGGDFNKVLKNIEYFLDQKKKKGLKLPITRVTSVLSSLTYDEKDNFQKFWETKVDLVEFQNFQAIKGTENLIPPRAVLNENFSCSSPWQQVVIRANGDVLACCSFYGLGMIVGNAKTESIYNIWNGEKMNKIREELKKNNFSFCASCDSCSKTVYVSRS